MTSQRHLSYHAVCVKYTRGHRVGVGGWAGAAVTVAVKLPEVNRHLGVDVLGVRHGPKLARVSHAGAAVLESLVSGGHERERRRLDVQETVHAHVLEHVAGVGVDSDSVDIAFGTVWHKLQSALALLLLQFEGYAADWTALDPLHQVRGEVSDLVPQICGRDRGHLLGDLLVHLEVQGQFGSVLLHDLARGPLHCIGADTTHGC